MNEKARFYIGVAYGSMKQTYGFKLLLLRVERKSNGFTMVLIRDQRESNGVTMVLLMGQRKSLVYIGFA